jgi:hypothetical protein
LNGTVARLDDEAALSPSCCAEPLGGDRGVLVSVVLDGEAGCDEIVKARANEEVDDVANRSSFHVKSTWQHPISWFSSTTLSNYRADRFSSHRMVLVPSGHRRPSNATDGLV